MDDIKNIQNEKVEVNHEELKDSKVRLEQSVRAKKFAIIRSECGAEINVTDFLTHDEKIQIAMLIAERILLLDEETGRGYVSVHKEAETMLTLLEAYTNLEIPEEGRYDFYYYIINSPMFNHIYDFMGDDAGSVLSMSNILVKSSIDQFNHNHSMDYYLKEMSKGSTLGAELLDNLNKATAEAGNIASVVGGKIAQKPMGNIINFSKRKR